MKTPFFVLFCMALAAPAWAGGDSLTVNLAGLKNDRGNVRVGLYADPATFRKEASAVAIRQVPATAGSLSVRFDDLPAGTYAIMAYHDEDANGELNRRFGMFPTEGYGLSNNPKISGPPRFADSAFQVDGSTQINIDITY
ncbi:MAG: DUF2141 domain-containing protein [Bacteroidota bacterium]